MPYRYHSLYGIVADHGTKRKRKTALLVDGEKISYGALLSQVESVAALLAEQGVGRGERVALFLRNSPEFVYALFAISKLGAVVVPINTFLKSEELDYILQDSGAKALIASTVHGKVVRGSQAAALCDFILWEGEGFEAHSDKDIAFGKIKEYDTAVEPTPSGLEECAVIIYTSGTTGKPKGAMLSNKNILSNVESGRRHIDVTPRDRAIVFLPMFHSFTFTIGIVLPLYVGASIVIIKSIKPFANIFKQVLTKRVTIFFGVPDVYNALAKAKLPWYFMWFNRIRAFISGAAALQPKTLEAMAKRFRRATLLEGYGLSEASPAVCMNTFGKQKPGSVGTALWGYEMKVVDSEMKELPRGEVGDIIVKGDNVMMGYLNRPEATAESVVNGWLLTGDMGYMDEEGFLYIVDRKKELIISKGINIYPREIEEVIDRFEGVKASAVIGIEDEKSGEVPVAYIELEEGVSTLDEAALKSYMRQHLANFKLPRQMYLIEALPKNATGKVLKRTLKENLQAEKQHQ